MIINIHQKWFNNRFNNVKDSSREYKQNKKEKKIWKNKDRDREPGLWRKRRKKSHHHLNLKKCLYKHKFHQT